MNGVEQVGLIVFVIAPQTFGSNRRHTKALLNGMDITILDDFIWRKISYNSIRDNIFVAVTNSSYRYENVRYEAGRVVWYKGYHYSAKKDFITYNAAANAVYTRPSNTPSSYWQRYIMK